MALYPDAQRKAQRELDAVVGPGRMPDFSHYEELKYTQAIIKEVLRWQPAAPVGMNSKMNVGLMT